MKAYAEGGNDSRNGGFPAQGVCMMDKWGTDGCTALTDR